ncbi:MAG TPA: tripartite tricarboxylate transporter permease [Thermoplasmata archaeon]|nr:tripartite tricarboxylate transporter permease [Thermoplasmata archaeon]
MDPAGFLGGFVLVTVLGVLTGMLTGLAPGIHVNNVAAFVLATETAWAGFLGAVVPESGGDAIPVLLAAYLMATAAAHAVFDFIPSVFLGAPTEDTALATLPGHRLLLGGQGAKAIALAARGAVLGTAFAVLVLIPLRALLADPVGLADRFRPWSAAFIGFVLLALLISERRGRRGDRIIRAVWVQALAGALGIATLRGSVPIDPSVVLFPLFSGLFGIPSLVFGMRGEPGSIPSQRIESLRPLNREDVRSAIRGTLAGASVSWLPGLSGGAAATLASLRFRKPIGPSQFMVVLGSVSTSTALLSVAVLYMIHRARSGAAVAVNELLSDYGTWTNPFAAPASLLVLVAGTALATALAAPLAVRTGRLVARWSTGDPRRVSALSLAVLIVLLAVVSGPVGLAIATLAAVVGLVPVALRVRRVHLMASLLVPVLLGYLTGA